MNIDVRLDDLSSTEVQALIAEHLAGMHQFTPPGQVHALAVGSLQAADVTCWTAWIGGALCGCGALKELNPRAGEIKSMRTRAAFLRRGVGQAVLDEIVRTARTRGYAGLWLETGTGPAFDPAHALYRRNGFEWTGPFADYTATPFNVFMTKPLDQWRVHEESRPAAGRADAPRATSMPLQTERLTVLVQTRRDVEAMVERMSDDERAQVSAAWLAMVQASADADPWVHGFSAVHRETGVPIGTAGFKGPPIDGVVELAYGIEPNFQGQGYATELARALVDYASAQEDVRIIRAHTLPTGAASRRVLEKCGFGVVGEVVDPEDGTVLRFERVVR